MKSISRRHLVLLIAILALALGLRAYRLDSQSLWNDEGTSLALAQRDLPTIIQNAADDIHPPLYYTVLHYWVRALGATEVAARALSVFTGVLVVLATYVLARMALSERAALLAALIAALSPFQVYYSQEVRMYILATLAGVLLVGACYALLEAWSRRPGSVVRWEAAALVLAGVALLYTHYYGITLLLAVNLGFLLWCLNRRRQGGALPWGAIGHWTLLQVLMVAAFAPWLLRTWHTVLNWPSVSAAMTLFELARQLMIVLPLGITVPVNAMALLIGLLSTGLAVGGVSALLRREQDHLPGRVHWRPWLLACYLVVPLLVMYLGSLRRPMYNPKFILLATPALHILQAAALAGMSRSWRDRAVSPHARVLKAVAALVLVLILLGGSVWSLGGLYSDPRYARDDYRGIIAYIRATAGPDAAILINAPSQIETVDYYHEEPPPMYPLARQRPMDVEQTISELEDIVRRHDQLYGIFWATADSDPEGVIEAWLAEHTFKTMDRWYGNIRLVVYATPPTGEAGAFKPVDYVLGDAIRLKGYRLLPASPRSGEIVQLALQWEAIEPLSATYTVFAQLLDGRQHIIGQHDSEPGGGAQPTDTWSPRETVTDNHGILIQPGTIPGPHTLLVGLYDASTGQRLGVSHQGEMIGDAIPLTEVEVSSPLRLPDPNELAIETAHEITWGSLTLMGHSLYPVARSHEVNPPLYAGDGLELVLFWRKEGPLTPPGAVRLTLTNAMGDSVWSGDIQPAHGAYAWDMWREGEIVRDVRHIIIPDDLERQTLRLTVAPLGTPDTRPEVLERLRITNR